MPIQAGFWAMSTMAPEEQTRQLGYVLTDIFLASISVAAAIGFILYGGRLFMMLQRFPIESRGRRKKLQEVGLVTSICAGCFSFRCVHACMHKLFTCFCRCGAAVVMVSFQLIRPCSMPWALGQIA